MIYRSGMSEQEIILRCQNMGIAELAIIIFIALIYCVGRFDPTYKEFPANMFLWVLVVDMLHGLFFGPLRWMSPSSPLYGLSSTISTAGCYFTAFIDTFFQLLSLYIHTAIIGVIFFVVFYSGNVRGEAGRKLSRGINMGLIVVPILAFLVLSAPPYRAFGFCIADGIPLFIKQTIWLTAVVWQVVMLAGIQYRIYHSSLSQAIKSLSAGTYLRFCGVVATQIIGVFTMMLVEFYGLTRLNAPRGVIRAMLFGVPGAHAMNILLMSNKLMGVAVRLLGKVFSSLGSIDKKSSRTRSKHSRGDVSSKGEDTDEERPESHKDKTESKSNPAHTVKRRSLAPQAKAVTATISQPPLTARKEREKEKEKEKNNTERAYALLRKKGGKCRSTPIGKICAFLFVSFYCAVILMIIYGWRWNTFLSSTRSFGVNLAVFAPLASLLHSVGTEASAIPIFLNSQGQTFALTFEVRANETDIQRNAFNNFLTTYKSTENYIYSSPEFQAGLMSLDSLDDERAKCRSLDTNPNAADQYFTSLASTFVDSLDHIARYHDQTNPLLPTATLSSRALALSMVVKVQTVLAQQRYLSLLALDARNGSELGLAPYLSVDQYLDYATARASQSVHAQAFSVFSPTQYQTRLQNLNDKYGDWMNQVQQFIMLNCIVVNNSNGNPAIQRLANSDSNQNQQWTAETLFDNHTRFLKDLNFIINDLSLDLNATASKNVTDQYMLLASFLFSFAFVSTATTFLFYATMSRLRNYVTDFDTLQEQFFPKINGQSELERVSTGGSKRATRVLLVALWLPVLLTLGSFFTLLSGTVTTAHDFGEVVDNLSSETFIKQYLDALETETESALQFIINNQSNSIAYNQTRRQYLEDQAVTDQMYQELRTFLTQSFDNSEVQGGPPFVTAITVGDQLRNMRYANAFVPEAYHTANASRFSLLSQYEGARSAFNDLLFDVARVTNDGPFDHPLLTFLAVFYAKAAFESVKNQGGIVFLHGGYIQGDEYCNYTLARGAEIAWGDLLVKTSNGDGLTHWTTLAATPEFTAVAEWDQKLIYNQSQLITQSSASEWYIMTANKNNAVFTVLQEQAQQLSLVVDSQTNYYVHSLTALVLTVCAVLVVAMFLAIDVFRIIFAMESRLVRFRRLAGTKSVAGQLKLPPGFILHEDSHQDRDRSGVGNDHGDISNALSPLTTARHTVVAFAKRTVQKGGDDNSGGAQGGVVSLPPAEDIQNLAAGFRETYLTLLLHKYSQDTMDGRVLAFCRDLSTSEMITALLNSCSASEQERFLTTAGQILTALNIITAHNKSPSPPSTSESELVGLYSSLRRIFMGFAKQNLQAAEDLHSTTVAHRLNDPDALSWIRQEAKAAGYERCIDFAAALSSLLVAAGKSGLEDGGSVPSSGMELSEGISKIREQFLLADSEGDSPHPIHTRNSKFLEIPPDLLSELRTMLVVDASGSVAGSAERARRKAERALDLVVGFVKDRLVTSRDFGSLFGALTR